ncbi:VOC family protein [Paenibacillus glycanilyticus]|uniref:VOC family protein n=1 Tax=Paenibacillus glycanilyticus TaxID=126569 RepID=A0ABQ6GHF8_9BACL|nr:VOC family protein [Paenibacillus glycanilyticus]GLX70258.1 VOC family protein [Paenibacillus glycanilyticus]
MIVGINPYLILNGDGQEAVAFYEHAFHTKALIVQRFGDMPEENANLSDEEKNRIVHAHLKVGATDLMISDTFTGLPYQIGDQTTLSIFISDVETTREVFGKLQDGGKVIISLHQTFWSPLYGQVVDRFGVTWQVSTQAAQ